VAGVYREYGNDRGEVLMSLGTYQRLWDDEALSGLGIYLAPGVEAAVAVGELRAARAAGRRSLSAPTPTFARYRCAFSSARS